MAREREVKVTILGDSKGGQRALAELEDRADKTGSKFDGLGDKIGSFGKVAAVGIAGAGVAVGGFLAKAVMGASDLAETMSKVGVVFGEEASQVTSFANQMAKDFGLPKGAILDAAASIGLIGKASGLSQGDAAKMSTQLGKLAADASSFYNVPLPEALQAIQSGLVGEAEPMRRFGVLLNEEAVNAEAARLGLEKRGKEFTEGAKAQARASLIMKGMTDASGDLERTQGSLSNRLRELKGRAENFATSVGTAVVPMVLKLMDAAENLGKRLEPAFSYISEVVGFIGPAFKSAFSGEGVTSDGIVGVAERIGVALRSVVDWVRSKWPQIRATMEDFVDWVKAVVVPEVQDVARFFIEQFSGIVQWVKANWPAISEAVGHVVRVIQELFERLVPIIRQQWDIMKTHIEGAIAVIKAVIETALNIINGDWGRIWNGVKDILAAVWDGIVEIVRGGVANVVDKFLGMAGTIVNAAAKAFGWMPFIGDDIERAAKAFEEFRNRVNASLRGIDSHKTVTIDMISRANNTNTGTAGDPSYNNSPAPAPAAYDGGSSYEFGHGITEGPVPGPRGQAVPIIAHGGEWVVTPEQMAMLGEPDSREWNSYFDPNRGKAGYYENEDGSWSPDSTYKGDGTYRSFYDGTQPATRSGAGVTVVVNVAGSVIAEHDLAQTVRTELLKYQRRSPLGWQFVTSSA